jgi:thiamine biosynthesis lipoprotein
VTTSALLLLSQIVLDLATVDANRVERQLALMGTELKLSVTASDRATALRASEAAVRALEATELRLSTWSKSSELARFNRTPVNVNTALSEALAGELERAVWCTRVTDGAFDPTVGALVDAWGLRQGGRLPSKTELARALDATGIKKLSVLEGVAQRHHPAVRIEEGGFGKGAGLNAALLAGRTAGASVLFLELGGQIAASSNDDQVFEVGIAHPYERDQTVATWHMPAGSLATTGNSERGFTFDGKRYAHILDPRSGRPVDDFGSLSVWTKDALIADCLATGLYVLGADAALEWIAAHHGVEGLVVSESEGGLSLRASPGLRGHITELIELSLTFESQDSTPN